MNNEKNGTLEQLDVLREELHRALQNEELSPTDILKISRSLDNVINLLMKPVK